MRLVHRQRRVLAVVIGALVAVAVAVAAIRGYGQVVMLVGLVSALFIAYIVRHRVRSQLVYRRQANPPDTAAGPRTRVSGRHSIGPDPS